MPTPDAPGDPYQRLLDEARHRSAVDARARERLLRTQLQEDAHFAGTLADLAEQRAHVVVRTDRDERHAGRVAVLGVDHVVLDRGDGATTVVALDAVTDVGPERAVRHDPATGSDRPALDRTLREVLARVAAADPRVVVRLRGHDTPLGGVLVGVGRDVVSVRPDGGAPDLVYVRIAAISSVTTGQATATGR